MHKQTTRYLGVQIGIGAIADENWQKRVELLRTRLRIACRVSTSMDGRGQILRSVFMPAVLYTALYFAPSKRRTDELRTLHDTFLWDGTLTPTGETKRRPIVASKLKLKKRAGGLSPPDLDPS